MTRGGARKGPFPGNGYNIDKIPRNMEKTEPG